MSKSHTHTFSSSNLHARTSTHTNMHTHSFPFSPLLIMFLYLTFKVPEIGMLLNQTCFFLQGSGSLKLRYRFGPAVHSGLFCFGSHASSPCAQQVIRKMIWFDYDVAARRTQKTGHILSILRPWQHLRATSFPCREIGVLFLNEKKHFKASR